MYHTLLFAAALLLPVTPLLDDCIPAGGSETWTFERPSLDTPGLPTSAEWVDGTGRPSAWDEDLFFDDWMGYGDPDATGPQGEPAASFEFSNAGGHIVGPNGALVEGAGECVEVYVRWSYLYQETVRRCDKVAIDGTGVENCYTVTVWRRWYVRNPASGTKDLCPC